MEIVQGEPVTRFCERAYLARAAACTVEAIE
jgi:hypothetical protein